MKYDRNKRPSQTEPRGPSDHDDRRAFCRISAAARQQRRSAFTLIETALALLAIGLGLMGLFALGRHGLESSKESDNDRRCIQMADAIFETLRSENARYVEQARTNRTLLVTWQQQWTETLHSATGKIPFPPVANMSNSTNLYLNFTTQWAPAFVPDEISLYEWNPRYTLQSGFTMHSPVAGGENQLLVQLVIYPDGDTYSSMPRIFTTSLSNNGGL